MKYVMLEDSLGGRHPVTFHDHLTHSIVAHGICREYRRENPAEFYNVVSAGFYNPETHDVYGKSESLNMECSPLDGARIYLGGAVSHLSDDVLTTSMEALDMLGRGRGA